MMTALLDPAKGQNDHINISRSLIHDQSEQKNCVGPETLRIVPTTSSLLVRHATGPGLMTKIALLVIMTGKEHCSPKYPASLLTHCWWETLKGVHRQQCRPRSDAAYCGIWSGSSLFANCNFCLEPNKPKKLHLIPLKKQMDSSSI